MQGRGCKAGQVEEGQSRAGQVEEARQGEEWQSIVGQHRARRGKSQAKSARQGKNTQSKSEQDEKWLGIVGQRTARRVKQGRAAQSEEWQGRLEKRKAAQDSARRG